MGLNSTFRWLLTASAIAMQSMIYNANLHLLCKEHRLLLAWLMFLFGSLIGVTYGRWMGSVTHPRMSLAMALGWGAVYAIGSGLICNMQCVAVGHCTSPFDVFEAHSKDPWLYMIIAALSFAVGVVAFRPDREPTGRQTVTMDSEMKPYERKSLRIGTVGVVVGALSALASWVAIVVSLAKQ